MTERIRFVAKGPTITEYGVPTETGSVTKYECWAEVLNTSMREFKDPATKVGFRRETPNFAIKFEFKVPIDTTWHVIWRGKEYSIEGLDPDFDKNNLTKLSCKAVE